MTTPLPKGIERDDTVHGRLYYTRAQMLAYGLDCVDAAVRQIQAARQPESKPGARSAAVDDLLSKMGMFR